MLAKVSPSSGDPPPALARARRRGWGEKSRLVLLLDNVYPYDGASQVVLVVKNPPANAGDVRDTNLIPV